MMATHVCECVCVGVHHVRNMSVSRQSDMQLMPTMVANAVLIMYWYCAQLLDMICLG